MMNIQNLLQSPLSWLFQKESATLVLFGSIPLKFGEMLRRQLYRYIFARLGNSVTIQPGANFIHAFAIEMGEDVRISRHVCIDCGAPNSKVVIGDRVWLDRGIDIRTLESGQVEIGESTYIGPYVCIAGPGHVKIGKGCLIASHSGIYANNHNFADPTCQIQSQGVTQIGIVIEDDCWLGSGVKVLDGVTIGRGSVVGAGAVVTKSLPPYTVAVGVPAKAISQRGRDWFARKLQLKRSLPH